MLPSLPPALRLPWKLPLRLLLSIPSPFTVTLASRHLHPGVPVRFQVVLGFLALIEPRDIQDPRPDESSPELRPRHVQEFPAQILIRKCELLVLRLQALAVRRDPDLQQVRRILRRRIEFAVHHARAGASCAAILRDESPRRFPCCRDVRARLRESRSGFPCRDGDAFRILGPARRCPHSTRAASGTACARGS